MKRLATLGAAIVIAAACGGVDDAVPTAVASTTTTTTVAAPTTITVAPTTAAPIATAALITTAAPTTAVAPTTSAALTTVAAARPSDAEFEQILEALYDRNDELFEDPANADVQTVCALGSDCETSTRTVVENLIAQGERVVGTPPNDVTAVRDVRDLGANEKSGLGVGTHFEVGFTLVYKSDVIGAIVDDRGSTVYNLVPPDDLSASRVLVRTAKDDDLPWRFVD